MDDPTPRSKKDRETECVFGGFLFPSKSPLFFRIMGCFSSELNFSVKTVKPRATFHRRSAIAGQYCA